MIEVTGLAKRIHDQAVEKKFWEPEPTANFCISRIFNELQEAFEATRKNKFFKKNVEDHIQRVSKDPELLLLIGDNDKDTLVRIITRSIEMGDFVPFCKEVKDTFEDEICDAIMLCLDATVGFHVPYSPLGYFLPEEKDEFKNKSPEKIDDFIVFLMKAVFKKKTSKRTGYRNHFYAFIRYYLEIRYYVRYKCRLAY